jgi:hypothetical protein
MYWTAIAATKTANILVNIIEPRLPSTPAISAPGMCGIGLISRAPDIAK